MVVRFESILRADIEQKKEENRNQSKFDSKSIPQNCTHQRGKSEDQPTTAANTHSHLTFVVRDNSWDYVLGAVVVEAGAVVVLVAAAVEDFDSSLFAGAGSAAIVLIFSMNAAGSGNLSDSNFE